MKFGTDFKFTTEESDGYHDAETLYLYSWKRTNYDLTDESDLECLAEECAEQYHSNCGWEHSSWNNGSESQSIFIWTSPGTKVEFEVWLEYEPSFRAHKKESK